MRLKRRGRGRAAERQRQREIIAETVADDLAATVATELLGHLVLLFLNVAFCRCGQAFNSFVPLGCELVYMSQE